MTIYVCINFFILVNQYHKHRLQLKSEEIRWVKQALFKQNEIENITVLGN